MAVQKLGASFVSRDGHIYGMDSDADVTIYSDKRVVVNEYGVAPMKYESKLTVDADGAIHLQLKDYHAKWPAMYLYNLPKGSFFLFPADKSPRFRMGGSGRGDVDRRDDALLAVSKDAVRRVGLREFGGGEGGLLFEGRG